MRNLSSSFGYFIKEAKTILRLNPLSNLLSLLSTGLIFFILTMVIAGWWISNEVITVIQGEAEISIYFNEDLDDIGLSQLLEKVVAFDGVREASVISDGEAYERMVDILGKEARVLEHFDDNPFTAFIEVKINLESIDKVIVDLEGLAEVDYIRDNREVLDRLREVGRLIKVVGYLVMMAVGASTLVIISHIIRQGVYNYKDEINTLRLLGAPEGFIALPFLIEGLLISLGGGIIASLLTFISLRGIFYQIQGPLPFIPLPPLAVMVRNLTILIIILSCGLGILGSLFGIANTEKIKARNKQISTK